MTRYTVTWHARGLGRRTRKTFRSWRGAVGWWAWLMVRDQSDTAGIESDGKDVTPPWPTRRVAALIRQEQETQAEIVRLQDAATARAAASR